VVVLLVVLSVAVVVVILWCRCTGRAWFAPHSASFSSPADGEMRTVGHAKSSEVVAQPLPEPNSFLQPSSLSGKRHVNPFSLSSNPSSMRAVPLIPGDPHHINRYSNRPYQVNGIVPWTGRPPVLRGPQPNCVVPTIELDGTVIPREQRVSPGLGLLETPKIYIDPHPTAAPSHDTCTAPRKGGFLLNAKVWRRFKMRVGATKRTRTTTTTKAPQERLQWFHQLIHFTPLAHSPPLTESDKSDTENVDGDGDAFVSDVDTAAASQVAAVVPVISVPPEIRKRGEGSTARSADSSSHRAPRPQEMSGPVLHRAPPPAGSLSSHPFSGEVVFGHDSKIEVPQQQLAAQALSSSNARKAKVPSPLSGPLF
jgi:hypothetical protein